MMSRLAHFDRATAKRRTAELLEQFDLGEASAKQVSTYSGGMRRRLDLAISLLSSPPVVFLDEPTTGLDPRSRAQMWHVVRGLAERGTTILLTTQYLEEADQLADRVSVLNHGEIVATGTPDQLKSGISGERVELTFDNEDTYRRAVAIGFGAGAVFDDDRNTVSVPATDPVHTTRELLAVSDTNGFGITNISILAPTLDDVFLALTSTGPKEVAA
jgi:ABC-2 type transport system ATP-binding protein